MNEQRRIMSSKHRAKNNKKKNETATPQCSADR